jgi:hypothetical protein
MGVTLGYKQDADHVSRRMATRLATLSAKPKLVSKDWMFSHYVLLGMDCVQIGGILKKDAKTIWSLMKFYGIPTRPRRSNSYQLPKGRVPGFSLTEDHKKSLRAARLKDGRLPFIKDGKHWLHHENAIHPNWKGGITPERQAFYLTDEWRLAVKVVWAKANATCERCGSHHNTAETRGTFHIHHIVSFSVVELRANPLNLVLLCRACHLFVHSNANVEKQFIKEK